MLGRRQLLRASATLGLASAVPASLGSALTGCGVSASAPVALGTIVEGGLGALAFDARGLSWALDARAGILEVREVDGALLRTIEELAHPAAIALDASGRAWVVEAASATLAVIDLDRGVIARHGAELLRGPRDVAIDADASVLVADALAHRVVRLDPSGRVVAMLGGPIVDERDEGVLNGPRGVAIADDGSVLVAEIGGARITRLASDGAWLETIASGLTAPRALRVGPDGRIAVADAVRGEVTLHDASGALLSTHRPTRVPEALAFAPDGALWISGRETGA